MKKYFLLLLLPCLVFSSSFSQENVDNKATISGYVKDSLTGEALTGAAIYVKELEKGANANAYGFFSLTVNQAKYLLLVNFVGYQEKRIEIDLKNKRW